MKSVSSILWKKLNRLFGQPSIMLNKLYGHSFPNKVCMTFRDCHFPVVSIKPWADMEDGCPAREGNFVFCSSGAWLSALSPPRSVGNTAVPPTWGFDFSRVSSEHHAIPSGGLFCSLPFEWQDKMSRYFTGRVKHPVGQAFYAVDASCPVGYLAPVLVTRSAVALSQCLCSSNPVLWNNGLKVQE